MRISVALLCTFIFIGSAGSLGASEEERSQDPALRTLYLDLSALFRQHYPDATGYFLKNKLHFEYNTRAFLIHKPTKMGVWQDPAPERGPDRGGISCDIELRKARYEGAAVVPQTFDEHYFKVLLIPYIPRRRDACLYARLSYPDKVNPAFLARFTELVNQFAKQAQGNAGWRNARSTGPSLWPNSRELMAGALAVAFDKNPDLRLVGDSGSVLLSHGMEKG